MSPFASWMLDKIESSDQSGNISFACLSCDLYFFLSSSSSVVDSDWSADDASVYGSSDQSSLAVAAAAPDEELVRPPFAAFEPPRVDPAPAVAPPLLCPRVDAAAPPLALVAAIVWSLKSE